MTHGFLALGSNLGDKRAYLEAALAALRREPAIEVGRVAGFYRSAALGPGVQGSYLNTVVEIFTSLSAPALLAVCQAIEQALGRVRTERWGPRTIDIDLLWLEGESWTTSELTLPHPEAHRRSFVLVPWCELAPELALQGKSVRQWSEQAEPLGIVPEP